jgi:hypothetical protein
MLGDLKNETVLTALDLEGVENRRTFVVELHVYDWTDDGDDATNHLFAGGMSDGDFTEVTKHSPFSVSST